MLNDILKSRNIRGIALIVTLMSAGCGSKKQRGEYLTPAEHTGFNNPVMVKDHITGKRLFYWDMNDTAAEQEKIVDIDIITEPKDDTDSQHGIQYVVAYDSFSVGTNSRLWKSHGTTFKITRESHILDADALGYAGRAAFGAQCAANNQNSLLEYLKKRR